MATPPCKHFRRGQQFRHAERVRNPMPPAYPLGGFQRPDSGCGRVATQAPGLPDDRLPDRQTTAPWAGVARVDAILPSGAAQVRRGAGLRRLGFHGRRAIGRNGGHLGRARGRAVSVKTGQEVGCLVAHFFHPYHPLGMCPMCPTCPVFGIQGHNAAPLIWLFPGHVGHIGHLFRGVSPRFFAGPSQCRS